MTLMLWLCTIPLVLIIILPLWGGWMALVSAAALLVVMLGICWALCSVASLQDKLPPQGRKSLGNGGAGRGGGPPGVGLFERRGST
jgi:hypothetical protein